VNYIRRHWRGEFSLARSFWVNFVLLDFLIQLLGNWSPAGIINVHPKTAALAFLVLVLVWFLVICPWQFVGIWRAGRRHLAETGKHFWARSAQLSVILALLIVGIGLYSRWPGYKDLFKMVFLKDPIAAYTVSLVRDDTLIHVAGSFGFGVVDEVAALLDYNPQVSGIILSSSGGRLYEGRELAGLIMDRGLDTYCLQGCYSACATAFIGGQNRYLGTGANLGFHAYGGSSANLRSFVDIAGEQQKDLRIYQQQGVAQDFLDRLFSTASHDDLWFPSSEELLAANVVHGVVAGVDIAPGLYRMSGDQIDKALLTVPVFRTIQEYEPEIYATIRAAFALQIEKGLGPMEIQRTIGRYVEQVAIVGLARAGDEAVVSYTRFRIELLQYLEQEEPLFCGQNILPQTDGAMLITDLLTQDQMAVMMEIFGRIIVDAYEKAPPPIDRIVAETDLSGVIATLGYTDSPLQPIVTSYEKEGQQACRAAIDLYTSVLGLDSAKVGNILRYLFSSKEKTGQAHGP
jgi:hypothetical protein